MLVEKEKFLKNFKEEERRAYEIIKALKSRNKSKASYLLNRKIILRNGVPTIVISITELPVVRIGDTQTTSDDEDFFSEVNLDNAY